MSALFSFKECKTMYDKHLLDFAKCVVEDDLRDDASDEEITAAAVKLLDEVEQYELSHGLAIKH